VGLDLELELQLVTRPDGPRHLDAHLVPFRGLYLDGSLAEPLVAVERYDAEPHADRGSRRVHGHPDARDGTPRPFLPAQVPRPRHAQRLQQLAARPPHVAAPFAPVLERVPAGAALDLVVHAHLDPRM